MTACTDPATNRLRQTTKPTYDRHTGRLKELTFDSNRDGRIDTWTEMDGSRPIRSRTDRNGDGRIDRWEYYDVHGRLTKVGFSRAGTEKPDAWAYSDPTGDVKRVEISSKGDESKIDRWEVYDPTRRSSGGVVGILLSAEEDTNADGKPDRWETYESGAIKTLVFDEDFDGRPDRRLTYHDSLLVLIESKPDEAGRYTHRVDVDK